MPTTAISGRWRHYATLRTGGHVATITRLEASPTYQAGPVYVVAFNGQLRRQVATWREATAYASNLLTMQIPNTQAPETR